MTIKEKVAYLQGLTEGMNTEETEDGRLFAAIIDILADMADEITSLSEDMHDFDAELEALSEEVDDLSENALDIGDELDALSDDLADVEKYIEELDIDDDDDFDFDDDDDDDNWDDWLDSIDFNEDGGFDSEPVIDGCAGCQKTDNAGGPISAYCPDCGAALEIGEADIARETVNCHACGREIALEIDEVDVDDDGDLAF